MSLAYGLSAAELKSLLLSVGTHRTQRRLTPIQVGQLFRRAMDAGATLQDCADLAGFRGASMVSRFLSLLTLEDDIQLLVDWGQSGATLSFSAAFELSRLGGADQTVLTEAVLAYRFSGAEVRETVQLRRRSGRTIDECIAEILRMRPQVIRRHVFVGAVTSPQVQARLAAMESAPRDALLGEIAAEVAGEATEPACRLGPDRFVLVGGDEVAAALNGLTDFERTINDQLQRRLDT